MNETLTLLVNNRRHTGWKSVRVTSGIQRAARDFSLTVSERFPGQNQPLRMTPGNACQILIGNDVVLTGYVDSVNILHNATDHQIVVAGRSKTQDLIDCGVVPPWTDISNQTIVQVANTLAEPYGVAIVDALGAETDVIPKLGPNPGDTVFAVIEKAARIKGALVTDDAQGRLVLTRAGKARATTALKLGDNVLGGNATFDHKERFRQYEVRGQDTGSNHKQGTAITEPKAVVEDQTVRRPRTKYIVEESLIDLNRAQQRARWEAAVSAGKSISVTFTLHGWRQRDGSLWEPNTLIRVDDPLLTIHRDLLVVEVVYSKDEQGTLSTLTLTPKEAYELIPTNKAVDNGVGTWEGSQEGVQVAS